MGKKISKKKYGGKDQIQKLEERRPYHHRKRENWYHNFIGVKDVKVGEVTEYEDRIVVRASIEKKKEICPPSG